MSFNGEGQVSALCTSLNIWPQKAAPRSESEREGHFSHNLIGS